MIVQGYDLVGDIHGHANPLYRLLDKLGYSPVDSVPFAPFPDAP
jgi:hypothetical protein